MSLWLDLLFLHGHIASPKLAQSLTLPRPTPSRPPKSKNNAQTPIKRAIVSLRLCLGIGDGALRYQ